MVTKSPSRTRMMTKIFINRTRLRRVGGSGPAILVKTKEGKISGSRVEILGPATVIQSPGDEPEVWIETDAAVRVVEGYIDGTGGDS